METIPYPAKIETITLELDAYANGLIVSDELMQDVNIIPLIKRDFLGLFLGLKVYIFGEQVQFEEVKYPANWKEAFKERWYPNWAKQRWPVRYKVHTWDCRYVYPSIRSELKSHKLVIPTIQELPFR